MNKSKNTTLFIFGFLAIFGLLTAIVLADSGYPAGVRSLSHGASSGFNESRYDPANTTAEAGNITELNLTAISATKTWQGYYGEVTGVITLEDADGYVFYNWTANEPDGEVYASVNSSVYWANITCFQWNATGTAQSINIWAVEDWYGIEDFDGDGINETYTSSLDDDWFIGTRNMTEVSPSNTCHATNVFRTIAGVNQPVDGDFENVILTDNDALVFGARIENDEADNRTDITGYDGQTHDFQLLVAENGQEGYEDTTTTYFFWAEIE